MEPSMTKRKNHRAEKTARKWGTNEEDPSPCSLPEKLSICSLPQELLRSILNEHSLDLKSLFQLSLVSKHFTSLVSQVQAVSFTIPSSGDVSIESLQKSHVHVLMRKLFLHSSEQDLAIREFLSSQNLNVPTFLEKLQNVKSIHLEYAYPGNGGMSNFSSPSVKFNDCGKIESYVALLAESVSKVTEVDPNDDNPHAEVLTELEQNRSRDRSWLSYMRYVEWICLTYVLVKDHTSLESVTITDSEKHSKLVTRGKGLQKFRTGGPLELLKQPSPRTGDIAMMGLIPVLHLPLSGYVMKGAFLQLAISHEDGNMPEAVFKDIEDDDFVLGEAMKEILKNHAKHIHTVPKSSTSRLRG